MTHVARLFLVPACATVLILGAGCGSTGTPAAAGADLTPPVLLAEENVATATLAELSSGPAISGQLTPAREATVRAQVGGSIVELDVDRGQPVRAGSVLARISSRDLDAALRSAQAAVSSAQNALTVAESEAKRTAALVEGGALAARDLEQARNAVAGAEAQLASATAREKSVRQQLDDTSPKAPFAGVVSDRPASLGDVVSPGTPIVTIIDPSSLRLEALVPSDQLSAVRPGATVTFTIRGYGDRTFTGKVERLSPTADPVTRQVTLFITLPNLNGRLIAGLFVEGRVKSATHTGVVVPESAVDETGPAPVVTRIRDGKAERVEVELGLRQPEDERVEITKGVAAGDVLVTGSARTVAPGTPVKVIASQGK